MHTLIAACRPSRYCHHACVGYQTWYGLMCAPFSYVDRYFFMVLPHTILGSGNLVNARNTVSSPRQRHYVGVTCQTIASIPFVPSNHRINAINIKGLVVSTFLTGASLSVLPHACQQQHPPELPLA